MKAVQKLIDCFIPAREPAPLGTCGRLKNKVADEEFSGQHTEMITVFTNAVHPKMAEKHTSAEKPGSLKAQEACAFTSSEMAALEQMPNGHKTQQLRHKAARNMLSARDLVGEQPGSGRLAAVHTSDSACGWSARERTAQEIHNELVLETKLSPQHPALTSCWLLRQIGQGAFSRVYLAVPRVAPEGAPAEPYVLKVVDLGRECKLRDDYKQILRAEGAWLSKFNQPGFVKCFNSWGATPAHGSAELPEHLVLALENLSGGMLLDRLKKGPMTEHHAAAAFYQMLTAIMFMHHMGYVHRDLKPDNVMLTSDWDPVRDADQPPPVKLIDLGMVLNYVESPNACGLMGSPGYMSPEAIRGHRHTPAMDMFSLGVLLFVMLTGCKPLPSAVCTKLSYDQMEATEYPGLNMLQFKRLSPESKDLVISLLQRRPQHRPSARAALQHPWLASNLRLWRDHGVDIRFMAITAHATKHVLLKSPSRDADLARSASRTRSRPSSRTHAKQDASALQSAPLAGTSERVVRPKAPVTSALHTAWQQVSESSDCDSSGRSGAGGAECDKAPAAAPPQHSLRNMLGLPYELPATATPPQRDHEPTCLPAVCTAVYATPQAQTSSQPSCRSSGDSSAVNSTPCSALTNTMPVMRAGPCARSASAPSPDSSELPSHVGSGSADSLVRVRVTTSKAMSPAGHSGEVTPKSACLDESPVSFPIP